MAQMQYGYAMCLDLSVRRFSGERTPGSVLESASLRLEETSGNSEPGGGRYGSGTTARRSRKSHA